MIALRLREIVVATGAAFLVSCGADQRETGSSVLAGVNFWRVTNDAAKAYPNLSPLDARKQYARDKFNDAWRNLETRTEKRALAASFYVGFSNLNGRAIPAYCAQMNVDIKAFADGFHRANKREEASLITVLEDEGLTRDDVWERQKRFAMAAAKSELMNAGGLHGSYAVCDDVRDNPQKYLLRAGFARQFPTIAKVLNSPS